MNFQAILLLFFASESLAKVDKTLESKTHGQDVVAAAIKKLQDQCVFENDHEFLKRIAWVQSAYGDNPKTFDSKAGIWDMSEDNFDVTLSPKSYGQNWGSIIQKIQAMLGVNYTSFNYQNGSLMVPFDGAIAQRFYIDSFKSKIPFKVEGQAELWRQFSPLNNPQKFINSVANIPPSCLSAGADILFMLDSSGSICQSQSGTAHGCENYENMLTLMKKVIDVLPYNSTDEYQFAVDVFSGSATHPIAFNGYKDTKGLLDLIDKKIKYIGYGTRTDEALTEAVTVTFTQAKGARDSNLGFPRVVILLTDGESNYAEKTKIAAQVAKQNGLVLFTVGVGNAFSPTSKGKVELEMIASYPKCMHMYLISKFEELLFGFADEIRSQTCHASAVSKEDQNEFSGELPQNKTKYFEIHVNISMGITFDLSLEKGEAEMYISTERNPDEVLYDYKLEATAEKSDKLYLSPEELAKLSGTSGSFAQFADENGQLPLYTSVKGLDVSNNFTFEFEPSVPTTSTTVTSTTVTTTTPPTTSTVTPKPTLKPTTKPPTKAPPKTTTTLKTTVVTETTMLSTSNVTSNFTEPTSPKPTPEKTTPNMGDRDRANLAAILLLFVIVRLY